MTQKFMKEYVYSYMTYESTLNAIFKAGNFSAFFNNVFDFWVVFGMVIVMVIGGGTLVTIYELCLMSKEAEIPGQSTNYVSELFDHIWLNWLFFFNFNHKIYMKFPSRIFVITAKLVSMFVFAIYLGYVFKRLSLSFIFDDDISSFQGGAQVLSESILLPFLGKYDYNYEKKSAYGLADQINQQEGVHLADAMIDEYWFLRRNASSVCEWHFAEKSFGSVQFALWTQSTYASGSMWTAQNTGIQNLRANMSFIYDLEQTYFDMNYTCTLYPNYKLLKRIVQPKSLVFEFGYYTGEYLMILGVAIFALIMGIFLNKAKSYYEKKKKILKTKKFLNSAESVILRKTDIFFEKHKEESLSILKYIENNLKQCFDLKSGIDKMISSIVCRNDKFSDALNKKKIA